MVAAIGAGRFDGFGILALTGGEGLIGLGRRAAGFTAPDRGVLPLTLDVITSPFLDVVTALEAPVGGGLTFPVYDLPVGR